jgi:hypothetical protein
LTGEDLTFGLAQEKAAAFLEQSGFVQVTNAVSTDLQRLYFSNDHRTVADGYGIVSARTPSS